MLSIAFRGTIQMPRKYPHVNEDYEGIEIQKVLWNEAEDERVVTLDEYRKAS
jgi:hypothetical protein